MSPVPLFEKGSYVCVQRVFLLVLKKESKRFNYAKKTRLFCSGKLEHCQFSFKFFG